MASIRKHKTGWRAEIARKGVRKSKVFATRQEAKDWAAREEYVILNASKLADRVTLATVMDRYAREVSPKKRGSRWEIIRLEALARDLMARKAIGDLERSDLAAWRDRRLREVTAGTVRREMALLGAVFTQARLEWGMIEVSPMDGVKKPKPPEKRTRRVSDDEMARLAFVAGDDLSKGTARAFHAFRLAIETGMRAGEIMRLTRAEVDLPRRVAHLPKTKNGTARDVPLSREAVRLIEALPGGDPLFGMSTAQLDALWRKVRDRSGVVDLTFHDARHEAITRLSRKLDVLALARMVGHKNISQLMTYYDETAEELARRLD